MSALDVLLAAQLNFVSPYVGSNGGDLLRYTNGQQVNVTWNTPFQLTTLELWRGPSDDGTYAVEVLAANRTQNERTYLWRATASKDLRDVEMFLRLQKSDQPNLCDGCTASSPVIRLAAADPDSSASYTADSNASATSASPPPTSSPALVEASPAATTTAAAAEAASASSPSISNSTKLGIGLGVGLGATVVIALLATILLLLRRRQQRRQQHDKNLAIERELRAAEARRSTGAESWLTKSSGKAKSYHGPFEFEDEGMVRPGSERLFEHPVTPSRMPSVLKRWR